MSSMSPTKYRFEYSFDRIVLKSISVSFTPPDVMIALSVPSSPLTSMRMSLSSCTRARRCSRLTALACMSGSIFDFSMMIGIRDDGTSVSRQFLNFLRLSFWNIY